MTLKHLCITHVIQSLSEQFMVENKLVAVRFNMDLYNKIDMHKLGNSDLIRNAVIQFLDESNESLPEDIEDNSISDELYNEVYNSMYNTEISPLKQEIKYLKDKIGGLETTAYCLKEDKIFLQNQLQAQTLLIAAKTPLLSRIKMKLLKQSPE